MTLTLEVAPEEGAAIAAAAVRQGVPVERYIVEAATEKAQREAAASRREAAVDGYGKFAGRGRTVDDFLHERREEAAREMSQAATRDRLCQAREQAA